MRVLMLSTDINILKEGSAVRARMIEYGALVEELRIIVVKRGTYNSEHKTQISANVFTYPASSFSKIFSLLKARSMGIEIVTSYKLQATRHFFP